MPRRPKTDDEADEEADDAEELSPEKQIAAKMKLPALLIQILSWTSAAMSALGLIYQVVDFIRRYEAMRDFGGLRFHITAFIVGVIFALLHIGWCLVLAHRARSLTEVDNYQAAITTCVMASLPCVSPCVVLSVPIGIWGFVILMQRDVRAYYFDFKK